MSTAALPALPGSSAEPGTGTAVVELFDALLDDAALGPEAASGAPGDLTASRARVAAGVGAHERALTGWSADLVGPLVVPAPAAEPLAAVLDPSHHRLRILLAATADAAPGAPSDGARQRLRAARDLLAEDDRVQLVGVRLAPPGPGDQAMARLLATLDFSAPAWVQVEPGPGSDGALRVLAADGAENLTLATGSVRGPGPAGWEPVAHLLRTAVDVGLAFRVTGAGSGVGPIAMLCAVRAALNGAQAPELAQILATEQPGPLASALRRMSEADAAVVRSFLVAVEVPDVGAGIGTLVDLGLVAPAD